MILIINNRSVNVPYIRKALRKLGVKYVERDQSSIYNFKQVQKIKGIILSGGHPDLDQPLYFSRLRANLMALINFDVPVLGICEGHEIIGDACGGEVSVLGTPSHYDNLPIKLKKRSKIFKGLPATIFGFERHGRYVRRAPKHLFEVVASSRKDVVEAMFHKYRPIFSTQFHPERMGDVGLKIFKNFIDICKKYKKRK